MQALWFSVHFMDFLRVFLCCDCFVQIQVVMDYLLGCRPPNTKLCWRFMVNQHLHWPTSIYHLCRNLIAFTAQKTHLVRPSFLNFILFIRHTFVEVHWLSARFTYSVLANHGAWIFDLKICLEFVINNSTRLGTLFVIEVRITRHAFRDIR